MSKLERLKARKRSLEGLLHNLDQMDAKLARRKAAKYEALSRWEKIKSFLFPEYEQKYCSAREHWQEKLNQVLWEIEEENYKQILKRYDTVFNKRKFDENTRLR